MLILLATALLALTTTNAPRNRERADRADATLRCTIALPYLRTRDPELKRMIVRSQRRDSAFVGPYSDQQRPSSYVAWRRPVATDPIYGQVVDVVNADESTRAGLGNSKRVILVWWSMYGDCEPQFPPNPSQLRSGDAFIAAIARPKDKWINGVPVIDMEWSSWAYLPAPFTSGLQQSTVEDFWNLFPLLPTQDHDLTDTRRRLKDWVARNPAVARRQPVMKQVCSVIVPFPEPRPRAEVESEVPPPDSKNDCDSLLTAR